MNTTQPISTDHLLHQLTWRYATKQFDPARKIPPTEWATLEESLTLSPSSYGLQPYRFVVVTDPALREKLVAASWGQRQVADSSHLVVFAAKRSITEADVDQYVARIAEVRGVPVSSLATLRQMIIGDVVSGPRAGVAAEWAARQAYIALGNFMTSAALLGIDACPMEGFVADQYDALLGLPALGLRAVVLCAAGYRAGSDTHAGLRKVRAPQQEIFVRT